MSYELAKQQASAGASGERRIHSSLGQPMMTIEDTRLSIVKKPMVALALWNGSPRDLDRPQRDQPTDPWLGDVFFPLTAVAAELDYPYYGNYGYSAPTIPSTTRQAVKDTLLPTPSMPKRASVRSASRPALRSDRNGTEMLMTSAGWTGIWISRPTIARFRIETATGRREMNVWTFVRLDTLSAPRRFRSSE